MRPTAVTISGASPMRWRSVIIRDSVAACNLPIPIAMSSTIRDIARGELRKFTSSRFASSRTLIARASSGTMSAASWRSHAYRRAPDSNQPPWAADSSSTTMVPGPTLLMSSMSVTNATSRTTCEWDIRWCSVTSSKSGVLRRSASSTAARRIVIIVFASVRHGAGENLDLPAEVLLACTTEPLRAWSGYLLRFQSRDLRGLRPRRLGTEYGHDVWYNCFHGTVNHDEENFILNFQSDDVPLNIINKCGTCGMVRLVSRKRPRESFYIHDACPGEAANTELTTER